MDWNIAKSIALLVQSIIFFSVKSSAMQTHMSVHINVLQC